MDQYSYKNNYGYNDVRERDFRVPPPPRPAYYNQNYTEQPPSYHREFLLPPSLPCVMPYFNKHVPPPNIQPPFIPPPAPVSYYKPAPISRFSSNNYTLPYENTNINKTPVHIDNTRSRNPELSRNLLLPSTSRPSKTEDRGYRRDDPDSHYRHDSTDSRYRHENTDSRYRHNNSDSSYRNDSSDSHYRRTRDSYSRSSSRPDDRYRRSRSRTSYRPEERRPRRSESKGKPESERDALLSNWRKNYCTTSEDISEKMKKLANKDDREKDIVRSTPAEKYYEREISNARIVKATGALTSLCNRFENHLLSRAQKVRDSKPLYEPPPRKNRARLCKHKTEKSDSSDSSSEEYLTDEEDCTMEELERKQKHPDRLHLEMWFNDPGEMNDGPLCRCSLKAQKSGIRHGIYAGEKSLKKCDVNSNNADRLYHYRITISPPTNFLTKTPTIIHHDDHEFIFEGFSMFSHFALEKLPTCKVIRFNIEYTILYYEEKSPDKFCIKELDFFHDYLFREVLELLDFNLKAVGDSQGCSQFHFMPRFVRDIEDGKEILSMCEVLKYLIDNSYRLIEKDFLTEMVRMSQHDWQNFADEVKGMVVTYPGKKPCSVRVDQLDRNLDKQTGKEKVFPEIVHFGIRPPQLSYAGNPDYQKAWRDYVKFRHLLANMPKPSFEDKRKLEAKEAKLQDMRTASKLKRDVTVAVSAEGFHRTGIMCDIVQHAMLIPVLVCHLRFHHSLDVLEENISYKFKNRYLLQLALTHPSYRENFGTNPDHARNSLTNCGIRQPEYGDRRIHYMNTRKRGINTLINIMSRFGKKDETESNITHNERLEFLGDAVVEFLTSIHLFFLFPDLEEGGLATYRAALVQNQHLAVLARKLCLDQFMLYAHGSDLCHDLELRHAMANCFEALMGALFLDGGIEVADKVFGQTLFKDESQLLEIWFTLPLHPLQEQEPDGDRHHVTNVKVLQKLSKFEDSIGVEFKHIRLLARAFTDRSIGYTNLTLGSNQRLEFLGDTVLQLISSEYLYKHFPEHHEGHLSLLRSSLVNNRTQAVVCNDLDLTSYAMYNNPKAELKTKDRADLLEALLGALYVDKGMDFCSTFCNVTLFPRLQTFIMNQDWNDPKSKLQQCCLTLRTMEGGEPDIPIYKVIECKGPTNTRVYTVAVYFRGKRLEKATGHSIQQAEMNAARQALEKSQDLFPQLDHQKRVIAKSMKKQKKQRGKGYCPATNINNQKSEPKSQPENTLPESYRQQNDLVTQARDSRNSKSNKRRRSYSKSPDRYTKSNYEYDINQPHCSKYLPKCSYENKKYPETSSSKQSYTKSSYDSNTKKEDRVLINDFNEAECRKQNRLGIEIISDEYLGRYSDDNMGIIMPQDIKPNYNYADAADHKIVIFDLKDAMILKDARL